MTAFGSVRSRQLATMQEWGFRTSVRSASRTNVGDKATKKDTSIHVNCYAAGTIILCNCSRVGQVAERALRFADRLLTCFPIDDGLPRRTNNGRNAVESSAEAYK